MIYPNMRVPEVVARHATWMSRRSVLSGLLSSCALVPFSGRAQTGTPDRHLSFLPYGLGDQDGRDWNNAAPIERIGHFAERAEPGQAFLFAVPEVNVPLQWSGQRMLWNNGGTSDAPMELHFGQLSGDGMFDQPAPDTATAQFRMVGNETGPEERPDAGGDPYMILGPRSSHMRFSGPVYDRSGGDGFFNIDADATLRDLVFSDIHARNVGRVIETEEGTIIEGLTVERCSAIGMIRGFVRFRDLSEATFRDLDLDADFIDGGGGRVCQIIKVDRGHSFEVRNVRLAKAVNALAAEERGSSYIQGDGLVFEEDTRDLRIDDCHASDMGDGGFDLKTENVHMTNCTATRCKLGIRIWSHHPDNLIEDCIVTEPVWRPRNDGSCLWVAGNLTARNCTLASVDDMSPIRFGNGPDGTPDATLKIEGGTITHTEGVDLVVGSAGTIELENVEINGVEVSGRFTWNGRRLRAR